MPDEKLLAQHGNYGNEIYQVNLDAWINGLPQGFRRISKT